MTAVTRPRVEPGEGFRVVKGKKPRPTIAPWMIVAVLGVVAFLGLGFARTSLDRAAFEMNELNRAIAVQEAINRDLRLEIARMESPARIAPLAVELGLVIPQTTHQLLVDLDTPAPALAGTEIPETNQ